MDGLGQLFIAQNGSVYALVPDSREPPPPRRGIPFIEQDVTAALLTQFLQRQQHQQQQQQQQQQEEEEEHEHRLRQQQLALQLDGLAVPNVPPQREDALHSLLTATLMQSYPAQAPANANATAGPAASSHLGPQAGPVPMPQQRRRMPSADSPSNSTRSGRSDSQSPPPSTRGGDRSERSHGLGVSGQISAKEKNRQAQRRFRERQKDLISNLKQRVEDLQNKVTDSEKEIIALKEENAMLRGRIEGKQQMSSVTLPAETLQSLLQLSGAGGFLGDMPLKPTRGGGAGVGAGGSSGSQVYRAGRGGGGGDVAMRGGDAGIRGPDATGRRGDFGARGCDAD